MLDEEEDDDEKERAEGSGRMAPRDIHRQISGMTVSKSLREESERMFEVKKEGGSVRLNCSLAPTKTDVMFFTLDCSNEKLALLILQMHSIRMSYCPLAISVSSSSSTSSGS